MRGNKTATAAQCETILREQMVGRLGMVDGETPYVVPVFYAFAEGRIIIHSAVCGLKMELLDSGRQVCFEVDSLEAVVPGAMPCDWSARYSSVLCFGHPQVVADSAERARLLSLLVERFVPGGGPLSEEAMGRTAVIVIDIEHMTGVGVSGDIMCTTSAMVAYHQQLISRSADRRPMPDRGCPSRHDTGSSCPAPNSSLRSTCRPVLASGCPSMPVPCPVATRGRDNGLPGVTPRMDRSLRGVEAVTVREREPALTTLGRLFARTSDPTRFLRLATMLITRQVREAKGAAVYAGRRLASDLRLIASCGDQFPAVWPAQFDLGPAGSPGQIHIPLRAAGDLTGILVVNSAAEPATIDFLRDAAPMVAAGTSLATDSDAIVRRWALIRSRTISDLSHELRTPLASIKGYATALLRDDVLWPDSERQDFLRIIEEESNVIERLITELLDSTMIDAGLFTITREPVLLARLVERVVAEFAFRTTPHRFAVRIPCGLPVLDADPHRLEQVLRNLIDNAVKYSPSGGLIVVRALLADNGVLVTVADQGIGIAPQHLNRLFERYYRIRDSQGGHQGGTGLGLPITREIIEAHNGTIWVESRLGRGTTISFRLPALGGQGDGG